MLKFSQYVTIEHIERETNKGDDMTYIYDQEAKSLAGWFLRGEVNEHNHEQLIESYLAEYGICQDSDRDTFMVRVRDFIREGLCQEN